MHRNLKTSFKDRSGENEIDVIETAYLHLYRRRSYSPCGQLRIIIIFAPTFLRRRRLCTFLRGVKNCCIGNMTSSSSKAKILKGIVH